ncbi:nicotinamide N-methyltransferase-like [Pseudophryne corroboree]|uniref:nicotinamide N-methyltransferase-like n=1 Tax=Pseudophryne corroboree TaxID=495146 RepID=UPI003081776A
MRELKCNCPLGEDVGGRRQKPRGAFSHAKELKDRSRWTTGVSLPLMSVHVGTSGSPNASMMSKLAVTSIASPSSLMVSYKYESYEEIPLPPYPTFLQFSPITITSDFNAKEFVETHFSHGEIDIIEECMGQPVKILHELFSSGQMTGQILIDISVGAVIYQLLSASNVFKEIYVMEFTDANIKHFKKWLEKGEDATDWSFTSKLVCDRQGNRDGWQEPEEKVRRAIKNVVKWDIFKNSCIDPQLVPIADCVISLWIINVISKTKEEFQRNVKSFTSRLKIGGHLLLFTVLDMTYYRVGQHKHFILTVDEAFVRESVVNAGFVIEKTDLWNATVESDIVDYKHMLFILARKEREV